MHTCASCHYNMALRVVNGSPPLQSRPYLHPSTAPLHRLPAPLSTLSHCPLWPAPAPHTGLFKRDPASGFADGHICSRMIKFIFPSVMDEILPSATSTLKSRVASWRIIKKTLASLEVRLTEDQYQCFARREVPETIAQFVISLKMELLRFSKTLKVRQLVV